MIDTFFLGGGMRFFLRWGLIIILTSIFPLPSIVFPQTHFEFTPGISLSEVYDDNIYLSGVTRVSDYITEIAPSLRLNTISEGGHITITYSPIFTIIRTRRIMIR